MSIRVTRPISWITAARKAFDEFPADVRDAALDALTVAADGATATVSKPMKGLGAGVFEVALRHRGNAFRLIYAVVPHEDVWIVHAFQKKSTQGIKTPKREIELIRNRLARLKEALR